MATTDVLVVGGGLVGCATAYYLAKRGVSVSLVERSQINAGASSRNAGSLHFQIEPRMVGALRSHPELLRQLVPVSRMASDDWRSLEKELGTNLEVAMHGGVVVGETPDDLAVLQQKVALENEVGLPTRMVEGVELHRLAPAISDKIGFGAWCPDEGHGNPRLATPAYANAALRTGVRIHSSCEVTGLERHGGRWCAQLGNGNGYGREVIETEVVVVACGAWSTPLLAKVGVDVPLRSIGLNMNITERVPPILTAMIQHIGRRLSIKQLQSGNVVMGGSWPARLFRSEGEDWPRSALLDQDSIIGNLQTACHVVPAVARMHLIRSWTGIASDTPDHLPLLGRVDGAPDLFMAAGGSSFTLGPTYARLLSELICTGRSALPLDIYQPNRFQGAPCQTA